MPDLIRHPEGLERTGFRLEFIPMKIGAGMTTFIKTVVYGQTLIKWRKTGLEYLLVSPGLSGTGERLRMLKWNEPLNIDTLLFARRPHLPTGRCDAPYIVVWPSITFENRWTGWKSFRAEPFIWLDRWVEKLFKNSFYLIRTVTSP